MQSITLHYAKIRGNEKNAVYPYKAEISKLDNLLKVCSLDHVGAWYQGNHRSKETFIKADCVMMDLDNDGTENPQEWLTPQDLAKRFTDCAFFVVYSKSHNRIKHKGEGTKERSPRPRFHLYFPLSKPVHTWQELRTLKQAMRAIAPELDKQAADSARFFFGVENPTGEIIEGENRVDLFLQDKKLWPETIPVKGHDSTEATNTPEAEPETWPEQETYKPVMQSRFNGLGVLEEIGTPIYQGEGHSELLRFADKVIFAYGDTDIARQLFEFRCKDYQGNCPPEHFAQIWKDAQKRFHSRKDWSWNEPRKKAILKAEKLISKLTKKELQKEAKELQKANKKAQKEAQKAEKEAKEAEKEAEKIKKKPLTLPAVETAITEIGVTVRLNVITREVEVSDLPNENEFTPELYRKADKTTRRKVNRDILPLFLTSHLRADGYSVNADYLDNAINVLTNANPFNPFRDMLMAETWDKTDRILPVARALHIDTMDYHYLTFFTKWLHQVIAMALNDAGQLSNDFVLVLQGRQHIGKTSLFRKLSMYPEWYLEGATINTQDKDSIIKATRVLICELGELDATLDKEQAALKAFLTSPFDTYRAPYGRSAMKYERRTTFCATVNPDEFLRDRTGNKRFVVIPVRERLDTDFIYSVMTRDYVAQLWRQVYETQYLAKGRENFRLTAEESDWSEQQNAAYQVKLNGEIELFDMLDWEKPESDWRMWNVSELISALQLKITATRLGTALRSVMQKDSRVQKVRKGTKNLYLLPPNKKCFSEKATNDFGVF